MPLPPYCKVTREPHSDLTFYVEYRPSQGSTSFVPAAIQPMASNVHIPDSNIIEISDSPIMSNPLGSQRAALAAKDLTGQKSRDSMKTTYHAGSLPASARGKLSDQSDSSKYKFLVSCFIQEIIEEDGRFKYGEKERIGK